MDSTQPTDKLTTDKLILLEENVRAARTELAATVDKHFRGVDGLMLAAVDLSRLGDAVRWEPSRGGQLFPHIYGLLPVEAVVSVTILERTPDGAVKLPA